MVVSEIKIAALLGSFQATVTGLPESSPPIVQVNVCSTAVVTDLGVELTAEILSYGTHLALSQAIGRSYNQIEFGEVSDCFCPYSKLVTQLYNDEIKF